MNPEPPLVVSKAAKASSGAVKIEKCASRSSSNNTRRSSRNKKTGTEKTTCGEDTSRSNAADDPIAQVAPIPDIEYEELPSDQWQMHMRYDCATPNSTSEYPVELFSQRMAYRLHREAVVLSGATWTLTLPYDALPKLEKFFYKTSKAWNSSLQSAFQRIALRMVRGILPTPNCIAEVVALRAVMKGSYHTCEQFYEDAYNDLPITDRDYDYDEVRRKCFDEADNIILKCLFGVGEYDFESNGAKEGFHELVDCDPGVPIDLSPGSPPIDRWFATDNTSDSEISTKVWRAWLDQRMNIYEEMDRCIIHGHDSGKQITYSKNLASINTGIPTHEIEHYSPKLLNMHSMRWFLSFRVEDMSNHITF